MNISYFSVPKWNVVFKVKEDCCYEKVVYFGPEIGVAGKIDQERDSLNSWDLLCYTCNPDLRIVPISAKRYCLLQELANKKQRLAA